MVLQRINADTVGMKVANALVTVKSNGAIKIADKELEGAGEYDVAGVGAHVFNNTASFLVEGMRVSVLWANENIANELVDMDGVIFLTHDTKTINTIVKEQEPRFVVLTDTETADTLEKDGVTMVREGNYKLTTQTLPAEDRIFILLT